MTRSKRRPRGARTACSARRTVSGAALPSSSPWTRVDLARGVGVAAREGVAQTGVAGDDPLEAEQLVLDAVDAALALGGREQRLHGEALEGVPEVALGGPALAGHVGDEAGGGLADLSAEERPRQALLVGRVTRRVGEGAAQRGAAVDDGRHREQLLGEGEPGALGQRGVEGGLDRPGRTA